MATLYVTIDSDPNKAVAVVDSVDVDDFIFLLVFC